MASGIRADRLNKAVPIRYGRHWCLWPRGLPPFCMYPSFRSVGRCWTSGALAAVTSQSPFWCLCRRYHFTPMPDDVTSGVTRHSRLPREVLITQRRTSTSSKAWVFQTAPYSDRSTTVAPGFICSTCLLLTPMALKLNLGNMKLMIILACPLASTRA